MSWDVFVQDLPPGITSTDQIPDGFVPGPIGKRSSLIARIKDVIPAADFSDPSHGRIHAPGYSIELFMGDAEDCTGIGLVCRGGEGAVAIVADILDRLQLKGLNGGCPGNIFSRDDAMASFRDWARFRDRVVGAPSAPTSDQTRRRPRRSGFLRRR